EEAGAGHQRGRGSGAGEAACPRGGGQRYATGPGGDDQAGAQVPRVCTVGRCLLGGLHVQQGGGQAGGEHNRCDQGGGDGAPAPGPEHREGPGAGGGGAGGGRGGGSGARRGPRSSGGGGGVRGAPGPPNPGAGPGASAAAPASVSTPKASRAPVSHGCGASSVASASTGRTRIA